MNVNLKHSKNLEVKAHEQLYTNLLLLTQVYPTSKEFNDVFKKDMFVKNNKAAFHQVIYFLLITLNPTLTKEKITMWPLYDVKQENKLRNEIVSYINQLNGLYEHANISNIMASHLISPGGFKFVKFMLKLSQLVVFEHLRRSDAINLLVPPIKHHVNNTVTQLATKNLRLTTKNIELATRHQIEKFMRDYDISMQKANDIILTEKRLNEEIKAVSKVYDAKKSFLNRRVSQTDSLKGIKTNFSTVEKIRNLYEECNLLYTYLLTENSCLEYKKDMWSIPNQVNHLIKTENNQLSLHQLLNTVTVLLNHKNLEIPSPSSTYLSHLTNEFIEINKKCASVNKNADKTKIDLLTAINTFQSDVTELYTVQNKLKRNSLVYIENYQSEEILAIPLDDSS